MPKSLSYQPIIRGIFEAFCGGCELFYGGNAFPIALRAVVNFRKLGIHFYIEHMKRVEMESHWDTQEIQEKILFYKEVTERDKLSKVSMS